MSEANNVFITLTEPCFIGSKWYPRGSHVELDKQRAKRFTNPGGGRKSVALPGKHDVKPAGRRSLPGPRTHQRFQGLVGTTRTRTNRARMAHRCLPTSPAMTC